MSPLLGFMRIQDFKTDGWSHYLGFGDRAVNEADMGPALVHLPC